MNLIILTGKLTGMETMVLDNGSHSVILGMETFEENPLRFRVVLRDADTINKALALAKPGMSVLVEGRLVRSSAAIAGKPMFEDNTVPAGNLVIHALSVSYGQSFVDQLQAESAVEKMKQENERKKKKTVSLDVLSAI